MKVLVTGSSGMLGSDLLNVLSCKGCDTFGLDHRNGDITDLKGVRKVVNEFRPDTVVHCAAYTDVDGCEKDPEKAFKVNGLGTKNMAISCQEVGASMVYISTDYVFDGGKKGPYDELDNPDPINVYGRSKLLGEYYAQHLLSRFSIIRTSWLFGRNGKNFVDTILTLFNKKDTLQIVDDQVGSPTLSKELASKVGEVIDRAGYGIYHVTNSGTCSWYEFATRVVQLADLKGKTVEPTDSETLKRPAKRPKNSALENRLFKLEEYGLLRPWEEALMEHLNEVKSTEHGGRC